MTDGRTPPPEDPDLFPATPDAEERDVPVEGGYGDEAPEFTGASAVEDDVPEDELVDGESEDDAEGSDEMDDAAFADKFGDGISDRENEGRTSKRTLALALGGLLIGAGVVLAVISFVLPEPHINDVRPDLKSKAEAARADLSDVHRQNLEALTKNGVQGDPTLSVVCGLLPGDAPRKEQCELRATSVVPTSELVDMSKIRTVPALDGDCTAAEAQIQDFNPFVTKLKSDGCPVPNEYRWVTFGGTPQVDAAAGWLMSGTAVANKPDAMAITTRHDLGQFDIGECPENGCGVDQIQLPQVDFKTDKVDDQAPQQ